MKRKDAPVFWDSSALVPLCCEQKQTKAARRMFRAHPQCIVWWATSIECVSALSKLARMGMLNSNERQEAVRVFSRLRTSWTEIAPTIDIRERAEKLLHIHELRAADALQLSAAMTWCKGNPKERGFICADKNLSDAASKEGFIVTRLE